MLNFEEFIIFQVIKLVINSLIENFLQILKNLRVYPSKIPAEITETLGSICIFPM